MELECRQETVQCWETVCRTTVEQEESAEMIVPDTCPDVGQILSSQPRLLLQGQEALDGRAEFSGLIKVCLLYRPEGETGVASMEVTLPFSASAEFPRITRQCVLQVCPRVLSADVHLLNSRKVLVKVVYQLELEVFQPQARALLSLVEDPAPYGIRQKTGVIKSFLTVGVQERRFTYQDTQVLPAGTPDAAELLGTQARCTCSEARIIGSKLMFKGEAVLKLLCRDDEGSIFPAEFHLPYSQIMDVGEDCEDGACQVSLLLTDVKCTPDPEDRRSFQVELAMEAQGTVRKTVETPVLSDLYSTSYDLDTEQADCPVTALLDQGEDQENARVMLEGEGVSGCQDIQVRLGRLRQRRDGEDLFLDQDVHVTALCPGENGMEGLETTATVSHRLNVREDGTCQFTAELLRDPTTAATVEGLEVSVPLVFRWTLLGQETRPVISRVTLGEKRETSEDAPSLVIRAVRPGQTLWDVAKAFSSTEEDILEASGLTDGELYPGQMLLIPRRAG